MMGRTTWIWAGGLSAALLGAALAGCGRRDSTTDTAAGPGTPPATTAPATIATGTATAAGSFEDVTKTWREIGQARADLEEHIRAKQLDQVHSAAFEIRDLVRTLPEKSAALPEDSRKSLEAQVKNVDQLARMLDEAGDSHNMPSTHTHQVAMNDALNAIQGLYPPGALPSEGRMHDDDQHGGRMRDPSMPAMGKSGGMPGKGKPAQGGGMGGGMGDDKMGGGGGMKGHM